MTASYVLTGRRGRHAWQVVRGSARGGEGG
jgi:hypothetical protein